MEKKIFIIIFLVLFASIPLIVSIPQFLIFQGHVKIDGRIAPAGTIINFSIEGKEIANATVNSLRQYGPVFIQGFKEFYGKPIDITIIDGTNKYEAEQKIKYIYPQDIYLNLSTITEKALKISESFPAGNIIKIQKTGTQIFNITAISGYNNEIDYSVFLDGILVSNTNNYNYLITNDDKGEHNIKIITNDGFLSVSKEWMLIIERPDVSSFDGATTDFNSLELNALNNVQNVVFEKTNKGKIEFLENLNLTGVTDLTNKIKIERGIVAIDTSFYPNLNKKAKITLTGLVYSTIPEIFYNDGFTTNPNSINKKCDFCKILNYTKSPTTNGILVFEVEHFSSFKVGESGSKHNLSLFPDLETCKSGVQGDLILKIKNPDEGDKFGLDDKINVEIDVTNNADEKKKIITEIYLYNINKDEVEEDSDNSEKINGGKKESFELSLNVPEDFEYDNYLVFVKTYEDGKENLQCNQKAVDIKLEREDNDIRISEITLNYKEAYVGDEIGVFIKIKNQGSDDEEGIYITVENVEFGINEKIGPFEIEEFGRHDTLSKTFNIKIPENAKQGDYNLSINAKGEKSSDSGDIAFKVLGKKVIAPIVLKNISLNKILSVENNIPITTISPDDILNVENPGVKKPSFSLEKYLNLIDFVLIFGIIVLIILIIIVQIRRH